MAILNTGVIPRANSTFGCNSTINSCYVGTVSPSTSWREELLRLDHSFTSSTRITFRGIHDHWDTTTPVPQWGNEVNSFPTVLNNFDGPGMSLITSISSVLSPSLVNNFSAGYTWQHILLGDVPGAGVSLSRAGLNSIQYPMGYLFNNGFGGKIPGIVIAGNNGAYGGAGFAVDTSYMPWSHLIETSTLHDDVSKVLGSHTLTFGIQFVHAGRTEGGAANGANTGDVQGLMTFSNVENAASTNNAFADFLLNNSATDYNPHSSGAIQYYQQDSRQVPYQTSYWLMEPYAQDDWRLNPHLTVNLGVRVSLFNNWKPVGQRLYNWVPSAYDPNVLNQANVAINYHTGYLWYPNQLSPYTLSANNGLDPILMNGLVACGQNNVPVSCQTSHLVNPAPRVGFAWDPVGDGKSSIRGGYGIFYEHGTGSEANAGSLMGNPPQVLSMTQEYPYSWRSIGYNGIGSSFANAAFPLNMISIPTQTVWPYVQQWSFSVEREISKSTVVTLAYVGSKGTHLAAAMQGNQLHPVSASDNPFAAHVPITSDLCAANSAQIASPPYPGSYFYFPNGTTVNYSDQPAVFLSLAAACNGTPGTDFAPISFSVNALRPYQGIGSILRIDNEASSIYHSLQFTLRRNYGPLDLGVSYTYGHSIDTASDRYESTFVDAFDLRANRASSDFDQRHLLNISYLYKLQILDKAKKVNAFLGGDSDVDQASESGFSRMTDILFADWTLSGITIYQSGTPFNIINGASASGISVDDNAGLALGLGPDSYPDINRKARNGCDVATLSANSKGTFGPLLGNPCIFVAPTGLTQGNAGRNSMFNPGRTNFDAALLREFKLWGDRSLEFRAEVFNVFNHTQFRIYDPLKGNTESNTVSCYGPWDSLYTVGTSFSAGAPGCNVGNGFLRPVDAHRPRTMQFGLKFVF